MDPGGFLNPQLERHVAEQLERPLRAKRRVHAEGCALDGNALPEEYVRAIVRRPGATRRLQRLHCHDDAQRRA
jgi:hypothetical protein